MSKALRKHTPVSLPQFDAQSSRVVLVEISVDGFLIVEFPDGSVATCDCLVGSSSLTQLRPGDVLLAVRAHGCTRPIAVGRIGPYQHTIVEDQVTLCANQTLILKCGDASIDLRADGKVLIRGEDVLVRAKGTKRIRAGTVSIN